jgi:hypothetical protein
MDRRRNGDRLARQVDSREGLRRFRNARKPLVKDLGVDMVEVEKDVILALADAAAFADLLRLGA